MSKQAHVKGLFRPAFASFKQLGAIAKVTLMLVLVACFASPHALGQLISPQNNTPVEPAAPANINELRHHYQQAKRYLVKAQYPQFKKHQKKAQKYVLAPYLQYAYLKQRLSKLPTKEVAKFLEASEDSYLRERLLSQWLYVLAKRKKWKTFIAFYEPSIKDKGTQCSHLYARYKTGDKSALDEVTNIWVSHKSLPKLCDPLFSAWRKAGKLSDATAWQRYVLAMEKKKIRLARYITSLMSDDYKKYAELFHKVYGYPSTIRSTSLYTEQSAPMRDIISYGIKRYARHDILDAAEQWLRYESSQLFTSETVVNTKAVLVRQLVRKGKFELAEQWITSSAELRSVKVMEPLIHHSLTEKNWPKVLQYIALLNKDEQNQKRWLYWKARALIETDQGDIHQLVATDIFDTLAQTRSFYGFLSADILGKDYNLQHKTASVSEQSQRYIVEIPAIQRAKELWLTNRYTEAQAEWQYTMSRLTDDQIIAAGDIARAWGQHNQAIRTMIYGKQWDMLDIRFPLAYKEQIDNVATSINIPPTLIFAIARQESAFLKNAKSRVGARGLMQLMPATAKETASKGGIKHSLVDLFDPAHNILLGSRYLKQLLDKYDNNTVFAAAAYNAGPYRVDRWLKDRPSSLPIDIWVETIPFRETRGYVKNVLAFEVIYAYRLGEKNLKLNTHTKFKKVL